MNQVSLKFMLSGIAVLLFAIAQPYFMYFDPFNIQPHTFYSVCAVGGLVLVILGAFRRN